MINFLRRNDLTTDWVRWAVGVLLVAGLFCPYLTSSTATAAPATVAVPAAAKPTATQVNNTLRALDRLRSFGYSINTPARADKAIRHWQKVNGLVVDGIVGPQTLGSLDLAATATVPAKRLNPPAPAPEPVGDVESIIRDVWPDDLEDRAVQIAWRESNHQPGVRNYCCFGLFQIYWTVHDVWMADFGVTSSDQLFDARTNAEMAYQLYLRAGSWQPWAL